MGHAFRSSSLRDKFEAYLDELSANVERQQVAELPASVWEWKEMNRTKLSICQSCLSSDEIENILTMFNHDWSVDLRSNCNRIVHFCRAGCCSSDDECHQKCRVALYAAAYRLWDIPLLYRWKHFEPAAEYVLRCLLLHGVLVSAWAHVCEPGDKEVNLQAVDEDNPDISPAMRQAVRVNKVLAMLTSPDAIAARFGEEREGEDPGH